VETLAPISLLGDVVRLNPLARDHVEGLLAAALEDRSSYSFTKVPDSHEAMAEYVAGLLEDQRLGFTLPFVQVSVATKRVVGTTRYLNIRWSDAGELYALEIGGTWLSASAQRTGINTEAKLLLLDHAFTTLGVRRVEIRTDERNERSRAAIARLGASFEGVLRRVQPSLALGEDGQYRNSAIYSVIDDEWPRVREHLESLRRSR